MSLNSLIGSEITPWLAGALVAMFIWGLHWHLANREARNLTIAGGAERGSTARKAYLWMGQFGALTFLAVEAGLALYYGFLWILTAQAATRLPQALWLPQAAAGALGASLSLVFWFFLHRLTVWDGDMGAEPGQGASWRRAYYYLGTGLATLIATLGAGEFLRTFLSVAAGVYFFSTGAGDVANWRALSAASLAMVIVALPMAIILWLRANRLIEMTSSAESLMDEVNALSRKLLVYAGMMAGTGLTLVTFGYLVWQGLLVLLGQPVANAQAFWQESLVPAVAYLPEGLVLWLTFSNIARGDIDWTQETEDAAMVRRLYYYVMAALGLVVFWYGLQALLVLGILLVAGLWPVSMLGNPQARGYFSLAAALFLAGAPVWWGHWRPAQELARWPGPVGYAERSSTLRKAYLYGVVLAAAVVSVITLGSVVVRAPDWLFGPTAATSLATSLVQLGGGIAVAITFWLTHAVVLRADGRLRSEDERALGFDLATGQAGQDVPGGEDVVTAAEATGDSLRSCGGPGGSRRKPVRFRHRFAGRDDRDFGGQRSGRVWRCDRARRAGRGRRCGRRGCSGDRESRTTPKVNRCRPRSGARRFSIVAVVDGDDGSLGVALLTALRQAFPDLVLWPVALSSTAQTEMQRSLGEHGPARGSEDGLARAARYRRPERHVDPGRPGRRPGRRNCPGDRQQPRPESAPAAT